MRRDLAIEALVLDCVYRIAEYRYTVWLHSILENGFAGFANMSDDELRRACAERGLRCEEDFRESPHEEFDDDPDADDDEEEETEARGFLPAARHSEVPECL